MDEKRNTRNKRERIDEIGFGGLKLIQRPGEFCYGIDAVLLADMAAGSGRCGSVVDLGTGTGVIPLILSSKTDTPLIVGVEVQKGSFDCAERNVKLNRLEGRIRMVNGDVADPDDVKKKLRQACGPALKDGRADVVVCNPPYVKCGGGLRSGFEARMIARHEIRGTLEDFMRCASMLLRERGDFYMIHRPARMTDIFSAARRWGLEPRTMRLISPRKGEEPNLVTIHCVKGGGSELKVLGEISVYRRDGGYTDEVLAVYGKGDHKDKNC